MNHETTEVPQSNEATEAKAPTTKKPRSPVFPDPLTLSVLVELPSGQLKLAYAKLMPSGGKQRHRLAEPSAEDVASGVRLLKTRKDGLSHLRRMLLAYLEFNGMHAALKGSLADLASSFIEAELGSGLVSLLQDGAMAPDEKVMRAWTEYQDQQRRRKAVEAIDRGAPKKSPAKEASGAEEDTDDQSRPGLRKETPYSKGLTAEQMRELLLLWIENQYVAAALSGNDFLACVSALEEPALLPPASKEPDWAKLLEVNGGVNNPHDLITLSSTIHRTLRYARRQVEGGQQRIAEMERTQATLEDANRRLQEQLLQLQGAVSEAQEDNRRLRNDVSSAGNLSLSALHEMRARMTGFLEGETTRYLRTALDAARSEPPRPKVIAERLETVLEQVQRQLDWLAAKERV